MKVEIDTHSGFCFGVMDAVQTAEKWLQTHSSLYCLGDIVHNEVEVERLSKLGLKIIRHEQFKELHDTHVLIRAHGEPPETYEIAKKNQIQLIDATCPVVLNLQNKIKEQYLAEKESQILIFGKPGHAEVVGLQGQTDNEAIVITSVEDLQQIDTSRPAHLYAQTTQNLEKYTQIIEKLTEIYKKKGRETDFHYQDTICRRVSNRAEQIKTFAKAYDMILFVSGEKSSNGLYLYQTCLTANPRSHFIFKIDQVDQIAFDSTTSIGICGATSTPMWLMEEVKKRVEERMTGTPKNETA